MELQYFSDLNLNINPNDEKIQSLWERLFSLQIRNIGVNQTFDCSTLEEKKKKGKGEKSEDPIPAPYIVKLPLQYVGKIKIFSRITIKFTEISEWFKIIKSNNLKKYDIVAVSPQSQAALQHACACSDVDIITHEPQESPCWRISHKLYRMAAIDRNIFFELTYSSAVIDSTCRRNTIQLSHIYYTIGKSKNLLVSSGTATEFNLRSPYDIINLCSVFGLDEKRAKAAIWINPRALIARAANRRQGKSVFRCDSDVMDDDFPTEKKREELNALKEDNK